MKFHEKLQVLRKERGFSQEELAERLDVSRQAVSKWESGQSYPETEKLIQISNLFGITVDHLLKDEPLHQRGEAPRGQYDGSFADYAMFPRRGRRYEYKSKKTLFGLPLVHIHLGFGAMRAKGIIAIGNIATGFLSFGLLSLGLLSSGILSLGLLTSGVLSFGLLLSVGAVALGTFAIGAVAIGYTTLGAVSIGMYSVGAVAVASRVAIGDHAYGYIAIGNSVAEGTHVFLNMDGSRNMPYQIDAEGARAAMARLSSIPTPIYRFLNWFFL